MSPFREGACVLLAGNSTHSVHIHFLEGMLSLSYWLYNSGGEGIKPFITSYTFPE
jgi:hypothetical protein